MKFSKLLAALMLTALASVSHAAVVAVDLNHDGNFNTRTGATPYTDKAVFLDAANGLLWTNTTVDGGTARTFAEADTFVNGLTLEGVSTWRIPTLSDFSHLYLTQGSNSSGMVMLPFAYLGTYVWTSDKQPSGSYLAFNTNTWIGPNPTYVDASSSIYDSQNPNRTVALFKAFSATTKMHVWAVSSIPEPETYAMLLAGLGLIGAAARRRKFQKV